MDISRNVLKKCGLIAALMWAGVAFAAPPRWISETPAKYPSDLYLIGRGVGSTLDEAQNRARGDLATIFEVRIEVATENTTTVSVSGKKEQVSKFASQQVSAKTEKVISGITIEETWRDPVTQDYHALAVLSKTRAAASLREELANVDHEVQEQLKIADETTDPFLKIGALNRAREASIKRDGFQASLKIVDQTGAGLSAPISQSAIQMRIAEALKRVRVVPEIAGDETPPEFAATLKGGVADAGFLATSMEKAEFILRGSLDGHFEKTSDGIVLVRGTIEVSLIEKESGTVRGSKAWPYKVSGLNAATARSRALLEAKKIFKEELRTAVIEFSAN